MRLFGLGGALGLLLSPSVAGCMHHGAMMGDHSKMGGMMGQHGASTCPHHRAGEGAEHPQSGQQRMMGGGAEQDAHRNCPLGAAAPDAAQTPPADTPPPTSSDQHHPQ